MDDLDAEECVIVRSGLNKADLKTVVVQVNSHHFKFSSVQSFRAFALVMLSNAAQFEETVTPKTKTQLKVIN